MPPASLPALAAISPGPTIANAPRTPRIQRGSLAVRRVFSAAGGKRWAGRRAGVRREQRAWWRGPPGAGTTPPEGRGPGGAYAPAEGSLTAAGAVTSSQRAEIIPSRLPVRITIAVMRGYDAAA